MDEREVYQADAIDLSLGGMSLRSSLLPGVGDQLACHFNLEDGRPIDTRGEVVWARDKGSRAGAFGVRFLDMDDVPENPPPRVDPRGDTMRADPMGGPLARAATDDSRVKLFIQGMDAPLRAKVRQRLPGVLVLGSDLSFLKLGERVQIDAARDRSEGVIHTVSVEVDAKTKVPRLVLTVETEPGAASRSPEATAKVTQASVHARATVAAPEAIAPTRESASNSRSRLELVDETSNSLDATDSILDDGEMEDMDAAPWFTRAVVSLRAGMRRAQEQGGPMLRSAAANVGGLLTRTADRVRARGATTSETPRVKPKLRPQHDQDAVETDPHGTGLSPRRNRRVMVYAGVAVVSVVGILAVVLSGSSTPAPPRPQLAVAPESAAPATGDTAAPANTGSTVNTAAPVEEPAPMGEGATEGRVLAAHGGNIPTDLAAANGVAGQPEEPVITTAPVRAARPALAPRAVTAPVPPAITLNNRAVAMAPAAVAAVARPVVLGNPNVRVGTTLHLRMDGPISALQGPGARGAAIVLTVPGRHSLDMAAPLAHLDPRMAGAAIMNRAAGAELTLRFHAAAPPFVARTRGNTLEIVLAPTPGAPAMRSARR